MLFRYSYLLLCHKYNKLSAQIWNSADNLRIMYRNNMIEWCSFSLILFFNIYPQGLFPSFLIIEYNRQATLYPDGENRSILPVSRINRAALHSQWQRAIFAVRNEIMIRTHILWTGEFRKLFLSVLTQILWIWRMRKE